MHMEKKKGTQLVYRDHCLQESFMKLLKYNQLTFYLHIYLYTQHSLGEIRGQLSRDLLPIQRDNVTCSVRVTDTHTLSLFCTLYCRAGRQAVTASL